ncbi:hypothetical protein ACFLYL_01945 [Chloroflexota bacterium]
MITKRIDTSSLTMLNFITRKDASNMVMGTQQIAEALIQVKIMLILAQPISLQPIFI